MKIANVRDFRNRLLSYLKEDESVVVTRHGRITGILHPIRDTDSLSELFRTKVGGAPGKDRTVETKALLMTQLRRTFGIRRGPVPDIREVHKAWKFKGSLSQEIIAEREKR